MSGSTAELDFSDLTGEDNGTDREDGISTQSEGESDCLTDCM